MKAMFSFSFLLLAGWESESFPRLKTKQFQVVARWLLAVHPINSVVV
jgi:hypothetical protein